MDVSQFDFDLPVSLIAQVPAPERGTSNLLVLNRRTGEVTHSNMSRLAEFFQAGDLLVVNDTKVYPARLLGVRVPSGGAVECLLLSQLDHDRWQALVHPGQKLQPGARMIFRGEHRTLHGEVLERHFHGRRTIRLWADGSANVDQVIDEIGHIPLPPYIKRKDEALDRERYQTMFARERGSVAAPTAGLHFTPAIIDALAAKGVERATLTLHVGYGTFQPVRADRVEEHKIDAERFCISETTAQKVNRAKAAGGRVIAVGTTTTRALESAAIEGGGVTAKSGRTDLFIYPGFRFQVIDGLMTNFHLPQSSLLMLVCAFAGRDAVFAAYRQAIARRYRFYSYGDAMLIL